MNREPSYPAYGPSPDDRHNGSWGAENGSPTMTYDEFTYYLSQAHQAYETASQNGETEKAAAYEGIFTDMCSQYPQYRERLGNDYRSDYSE